MSASDHAETPFWQTIPLARMSPEQWESLCDGCGKCCLNKYEDEDTGALHYTSIACRLLDQQQGCCADYENRAKRVADCVTLTPGNLREPAWLPETCAYRRIAENRALPEWHPLLTGDPRSVHRAGHGVHGRVQSEVEVDDPLMFLIDWVR
ncbi:MAG: YcgN family cysteine cluster protein [Thiohalocapsa sp.]